MVVRIGVAGLGVLGRDDVDGQAVLGVHEDQPAVLRGLLHGAEDRAVVAEEDAGIGGEELEVGHALLDERVHLGQGRIGDVAHDHVEAVVDRGLALGLGVPCVEALAQRRPLPWTAKSMIVVVPPKAAARVPVSKVSLAKVPPNGSSMWVCTSIAPGITHLPDGVDRAVGGDVELLADEGDRLAVDQHVGWGGGIGVDDRPALDQRAHRFLRHRLNMDGASYRVYDRFMTTSTETDRLHFTGDDEADRLLVTSRWR